MVADTDRRTLARLSVGALGVVYGDIGTSPLYAIKECFGGPHGLDPTPENVLGILSLVVWALLLVVVVKYLGFITRADNAGEGGVLALFALALPRRTDPRRRRRATGAVLTAGLFGAALLYGDGMITPAISVLSAVEGLGVATDRLAPFVVPVTVAILVALFLIQRRGTGQIGRLFGPATLIWFVAIAALGLPAIVRRPEILLAISPHHAVRLFMSQPGPAFLVLGAVVLVITGGEALYADMGHFGRRPIRAAWFTIVMPALLASYLGQGALLLERGREAAANPFFSLAPRVLLYPTVAIATIATVIASQALISGVFSITHQAVQLGYWPRVQVVHTSGAAAGQIYIPEMSYALLLGCVALVLGFGSSSALAAAYGIAVTGTMAITSILFYVVSRVRWGWPRPRALALVAVFLVVDVAFFSSNLVKLREGGWFPIAIALALFTVMSTWKQGRTRLSTAVAQATLPLDLFLDDLERSRPHRVAGTAVFMTSNPEGVPLVLLHHFKHNKVLHQQVVLLSVVIERVPVVHGRDRVELTPLGHGFFRVIAHYGFMQHPDIPRTLRRAGRLGLSTVPDATSFFLGRETFIVTARPGMARWRKALFAFLSRNARTATAFYRLPPNRVVEIGAQIEL